MNNPFITKRSLAAAAAVIMLASLSGCSDSDKSSSDDSKASETTQTTAANNDSTADSTDDSKESVPAAADASEIKALNDKIEELSARVDELQEQLENGFDFGGDYHEVYDDTAVVEAYKKKDPSGLTDEKDKYIYDNLVAAVDEIITDGMTEYEKELAVYDYVFYGTRFDKDNLSPIDFSDEDNSHNPYGFFHDHTTICVGNATTFKLFMDVLGIDCEIIHSTEQGEHAWNIVKIDGDWYHVDVTFDGGDRKPMYSAFNVTDETKSMAGYPWDPEDFHECTATKYNYVLMNAQEVDDIYKLPALLKKAIDDNEQALYLTFKVPEGADLYAFTAQGAAILNGLESERYYFNVGEPVFGEDEDSLTVPISIYDNEAEDPDYPYDPGEDGSYDTGIDVGKMADAFDDAFDGEVRVSDDADEYFRYAYSDLKSTSVVDTEF